MEFCQRCGAIMSVSNGALLCSCGHAQDAMKTSLRETAKKRPKTVGVVDHSTHVLATFDHICSKCGFDKAQLVSKGIFVSDEDESLEYICGKCGYHDKEDGLKIT